MVYIYSTLSSSQRYGTEAGEVLVAGGASVSNRHLYTPSGVVTKVSDETAAALAKHSGFRAHIKRGFITVSKTERNPDDVSKDMGKDKSAQGTKATVTGKLKDA